MNSLHCVAVALLTLGGEAGSSEPADDELAAVWDDVEATWNVVRYHSGNLGWGALDGSGEPLGARVVIRGDRVTLQQPNGQRAAYRAELVGIKDGVYRVDLHGIGKQPAALRQGLAVVEEDKITCRFAREGETRPRRLERLEGGATTDYLIVRRSRP